MKIEDLKRQVINCEIEVDRKVVDDLMKDLLEFIEADAMDELEYIDLLKVAVFEIFSE